MDCSKYTLIPLPVQIKTSLGSYHLSPQTHIFCDPKCESVGNMVKIWLELITKSSISFQTQIQTFPNVDYVIIRLLNEETGLGTEGYQLEVTEKGIEIAAPKPVGIFYALQTLKQLIPPEGDLLLPAVSITDYPRFAWRGFMLDVARHFWTVDHVKRTMDIMAFFKLNILHLGLTNDQGWRIEIKKYPKLTEIGSKRARTKINGYLSKDWDPQPYSGFYTQADIKDLLQYAQDRFIQIIPEINMPGHCMASLASYPENSCTGGPFEVQPTFGIKKDVYCIGKEHTFEFLQNILLEIMDLFPSHIIHCGGDEVPRTRWEACPECQARVVNEHLKDTNALQTYFANRMAKFLADHGRRMMGWNEILDDNLVPQAIAQWWARGKDKVLKHLRQGRNFVMSHVLSVYLDYDYNYLPLHKIYEWNPFPKELEPQYYANVLGVETPLWTEWVRTPKRFDWQTFPRLIGFAENAWTPAVQKNYRDFRNRLDRMKSQLDAMGIHYASFDIVDPPLWKRIWGLRTIPNGGTYSHFVKE